MKEMKKIGKKAVVKHLKEDMKESKESMKKDMKLAKEMKSKKC
jgi:hypothetical protein